MLAKSSTDNEIIDFIFNLFYDDGSYNYLDYLSIKNEIGDEIHPWDIERLIKKMTNNGWICKPNYESNLYQLNAKGFEIMREHGGYIEYLHYLKKEEKKQNRGEIIDRNIKNGNIIAALLISSMTLILTQCPIGSTKQQEKIEQGMKSIATQLDSLKQALRNIPKQTEQRIALDTATQK